MNIENMKQQWQKSFDKSVASVENYLTPENPDYHEAAQFRELAQWLLENNCNPYDYMTNGYQDFRSTPFKTESLFATLHHALCDDGEVSFVKMKIDGEVQRVFMIFIWPNEDCFETACKKENESLINSHIKGSESLRRLRIMMQQKNPEKNIIVKPSITEKDVTFEVHHDPINFIIEVEELQLKKKKKAQETDEKMSQLRKNKP